MLAQNTGIFSEPAAAAAFAGYRAFQKKKLLPEGSVNVVLLTGSGLKDLGAVQRRLNISPPVKPDMISIESYLKGKI